MVKMSETSTKTVDRTETLSTFATLRISGDRLDPARVTAILGVPPTLSYRKGEAYRGSRGPAARGRTGVWYISTRGDVDSSELTDHLRYLVAMLSPTVGSDHLTALRQLLEQDGLEADVSCFWHGREGAQEPVIPRFAVDTFARLGASLETDFDTD
jgi:hypothetical protein